MADKAKQVANAISKNRLNIQNPLEGASQYFVDPNTQPGPEEPGLLRKIVNLFLDRTNPAGMSPMPMMLTTPVYHGTNQVFNEFVNSKLARDTLYGVGHYFTDSPEVASGYAQQKMTWVPKKIAENISNWDARLAALKDKSIELVQKGPDSFDLIKNVPEPTYPNVHKVFLNIDKPFDIAKDRLSPEQLKQLGINATEGSLDVLKSKFPGIEEHFPEMLQKLGYDSMVYPGGQMYSGVTPHRVFIVNDPSKIIPAFSGQVAQNIQNARTLLK